MPSREVSRLRRLKIDNLSEDRLRAELKRTTTNFEKENQALERRNTKLQASVTRMTTQIERSKAQLAKQEEQLKAAKKEHSQALSEADQLRSKLDEFEASAVINTESARFLQHINQLEFEKIQLESQVKSTKALLENVQMAQTARDESRTPISTRDLYSKMATEVAEAAADLPAGFEIHDVEVEVRGALGHEGDQVILGLDAKQSITGDSATRLQFTLRRTTTETKVD